MKHNLSKISLAATALLFAALFGLSSCKKDNDDSKPTPTQQIVGEWEIKSFTIDGVEIKGTVVLSSKMEFEAYTGSNGDFEWTIVYTDGSSEVATGDYEVDEADREVKLENDNGETLKFDFDLDGDELELSGILDGERYVLNAERD
ncbi:MAG TPA: hypothetical protein PKL15_11620 [Saprospiraceae bacterium]|nr:hypothetical protein [Saprospiraceae bacterium]HNL39401.1 hypothetical protein [Saprospiraceae bacterium]HNM26074.1 hypothetical protein [Saprospiraceae bacterium]